MSVKERETKSDNYYFSAKYYASDVRRFMTLNLPSADQQSEDLLRRRSYIATTV